MIVVAQRVSTASVWVEKQRVGAIGPGLLLLIGVADKDTPQDIEFVAGKCVNLRIFGDEEGKMNRSVLDTKGQILAISQFTLFGNTSKGRRPSFVHAAPPEKAELYYNLFIDKLKSFGIHVESGIFGAMMDVQLTNQGPVTLIVHSK